MLKRILLGIFTLGSLTFAVYLYSNFLFGNISFEETGSGILPTDMVLFAVNSLVILGLFIFYLVYILTSETLSKGRKWFWGIFIALFNILGMTLFYFFNVLPRGKSD